MNTNTFKKDKALNDKKITEFTNQDFWDLSIEKYRISKILRKLIKKNNHYDFNGFSKLIGFSRHYIYQVMTMNIKPSKEFIEKINQIKSNE
ncbi:hypothetical protein LLG07_06130 [bacterium]|nr:hypothetical protein [bacterium]